MSNFYRILNQAFVVVYGRERKAASLGTADDMPTDIKEGADSYKPELENPLLEKAKAAKWRHDKTINQQHRSSFQGRSRSKCRGYACTTRKQPKAIPFKEGLRKQDAPG